jgi:hypothetical protein
VLAQRDWNLQERDIEMVIPKKQKQVVDFASDMDVILLETVDGDVMTSYFQLDSRFILHSSFVYGYCVNYKLMEMN